MAFTLTTTMPGGNANYAKYIMTTNPTRADRTNSSMQMDFTLVGWDSAFVPLKRGSYISMTTDTYGLWFTGYVTGEPERTYQGTNNGIPVWSYLIKATSDDYILNLSTIGVQPVFINKTMGEVIKVLADKMAPGTFDYSGIDAGQVLASYSISPDKKLQDIIKDFTDSANCVFWALNHKLYFKQQDYAFSCAAIDGASTNFTPTKLAIRPSLNTVINDCVVVGDVEPEAYITEYISGNGFDAKFPLLAAVYGADYYTLLNESFSGSSFDSQTWTAYDTATHYLQLYNGYLNVIGGSNNSSYDVSLQSKYPVQLEGSIRMTHGEWDFLPQSVTNQLDGVICGLWTQNPNPSYTGCVFGIIVQHNSGGTLVINPVVNGASDVSQYMTPNTTGAKRYVIRSIVSFNHLHRNSQSQAYRDKLGTVHSINYSSDPTLAYWTTYINEIDVTTGKLTNSVVWNNDGVLITSGRTYATYIPVASNNIHATVTGITLSLPMQASLDKSVVARFDNSNFDQWVSDTIPANWDFVIGAAKYTTGLPTGTAALQLLSTNPTGFTAYCSRLANGLLDPGKKYWVSFKAMCSSDFTSSLTVDLTDPSSTVTTVAGFATSLSSSGFVTYRGVLTTPLGAVGTLLPTTLLLRVYITSNTTTPINSWVVVDDMFVYDDWQAMNIGPNDIDSLDGTVTVATIVSGSSTPQTTTYTGDPVYNPGASDLVFFKDTALQTSTTPQPNELYRLCYRASANCYGRARNSASITAEAAIWGDAGIRSIIKQDTKPRPRNSKECEITAATIVGQDGYQHYDGTYEVYSDYSGGQPRAGTILRFSNLPAGLPPVVSEEIHSIQTVLVSLRPERFLHTITFGEPDYVRQILAKFADDKGSFLQYHRSQTTDTQVIDIKNVGLGFAPDVAEPILYAWDETTFYLDCNQPLTTGTGFEIRYSDSNWGADDSRNLVTRLNYPTTTFSIPREDKTKAIFIKQFDRRNLFVFSEDPTQQSIGGSTTITLDKQPNPDGRVSIVGNVSLGDYVIGFSDASQSIAAGVSFSGSVSLKAVPGSEGTQLNVVATQSGTTLASQTITLTGSWQRYSITGTTINTTQLGFGISAPSVHLNVFATMFSIEVNTSFETLYAKTLGTAYGALSRFPSAIRLAFPTKGTIGAFVDSTLEVDTLNYTTIIAPPSQVVNVTATSVIVPNAAVKSIASAANIVLNTIPVINGGVQGQYLTLINIGTFKITLKSSLTLTGSSLVVGADVLLDPNASINLYYLAGKGWIQAGTVNVNNTDLITLSRYV